MLDCINSPDLKGINCKYIPDAVKLPTLSAYVLTRMFITRKPFIWRFHFDNICTGYPVQFKLDIVKNATFISGTLAIFLHKQ